MRGTGLAVVWERIDEVGMAAARQKAKVRQLPQRALHLAHALNRILPTKFSTTPLARYARHLQTRVSQRKVRGAMARQAIEAIRRIRAQLSPAFHVVLGVSNLSFGLLLQPPESWLNSVFLHECCSARS